MAFGVRIPWFSHKNEVIRRLFRIIDVFMVPAVHRKATDQIEMLLRELTDREVRHLDKVTVMGICRLLLETNQPGAAARLLERYIQEGRSDRLWYFLEPIMELHNLGAWKDGAFQQFCAKFQPPLSALALQWLRTGYKSADNADQQNFQRFIVEPLCALSKDDRNLMDIRFSPQQRAALQAEIKKSIIDERPLSLLRLGDGEAYPYPAPPVKGLSASLFAEDDRNFELHRWGWGASDPVREELVTRFRRAVARCDILGFPSVYRIIRNMTPPRSRYGNRRNQRAFLRILSSLGSAIPIGQRIFTEERCHRVRGAIDAPFLLEVSAMARSVVLMSSWPELRSKFPSELSIHDIQVPSGKELFTRYPELIERVREVSGPGTVVLIGAGIIAKISR